MEGGVANNRDKLKSLTSSLGRKATKATSVIEHASSVTGTILSEKIDNVFDTVRINVGEIVDDMPTTLDVFNNFDDEFKESEKSRGESPKQEDSPFD